MHFLDEGERGESHVQHLVDSPRPLKRFTRKKREAVKAN
jgi:hypothetical protein